MVPIKSYSSCVVLTGAGISQESGVPTFRGKEGLWRNFRPEELATPEAFSRNPSLVWEWYFFRRGLVGKARPNRGHEVLVEMEKFFPEFLLSTQNVDGLHAMAGSINIRELHGNIWRVKCLKENHLKEERSLFSETLPPVCFCGSVLRPDVVWFGEPLPEKAWAETVEAVMKADLFLAIGSSLNVAPANQLAIMARQSGAHLVLVNAEPTPMDSLFHEKYFGKSGEILPVLWGKQLT